jgi:benzoylformate decarboxylase
MYEPGPYLEPTTRVAVISADAEQLHRSAATLALLGPPGPIAAAAAALLDARPFDPGAGALHSPPPAPAPPAPGEPLRAGHVLAALAARLPPEAIVVEECPSNRPELLERIQARIPMGLLSNANGGLGFGITSAIGLRMGAPERPVVAVLGDGSTMYAIQALWSAARYGCGVALIVLANGSYAVMDALARDAGGAGAWPGFGEVSIATIAEGFGCPAQRISTHDELISALDELVATLASREAPLLLEVAVAP